MKKIIWIKIQVQIWHHVRPKRLMWPQIWVLGNFMTCWHFTLLWLCRRFSLTFHWNFDHNLHRLILTYIENVHGLNTKKLSLLLWYMTENYWAKAVAWFFNFESAKKILIKPYAGVRKCVMQITLHQLTMFLDIDRFLQEICHMCKLQKYTNASSHFELLMIIYSLSMKVYLEMSYRNIDQNTKL